MSETDPNFSVKGIIAGRALPQATVRYYERAGVLELAALDTGVFFIVAWWSLPALLALLRLTQALRKTDPQGKLTLCIADTDGCPELYDHPLLAGKLLGYGESIWKRNHDVVDTLLRAGEITDYEDCIRRLLG